MAGVIPPNLAEPRLLILTVEQEIHDLHELLVVPFGILGKFTLVWVRLIGRGRSSNTFTSLSTRNRWASIPLSLSSLEIRSLNRWNSSMMTRSGFRRSRADTRKDTPQGVDDVPTFRIGDSHDIIVQADFQDMLQQLRFLLKSSMDGLHHVAEVVAAIRIAVFYALLIPINIAIPVHQRIIDLQKLIQLSLAVFKGWVMGQDNENQGTLVLGTAAAHHGRMWRSHGISCW